MSVLVLDSARSRFMDSRACPLWLIRQRCAFIGIQLVGIVSGLPVIREQLREAPMSQLFAPLNDVREELVLRSFTRVLKHSQHCLFRFAKLDMHNGDHARSGCRIA